MIDLDDLRWHLIGALEELQQGRCGICGREDLTRRLAVDHDHASGMIRGLLCIRCNLAEGQHGTCGRGDRCAICMWRNQPAVTWLGWTVATGPSAAPFAYGSAEKLVARFAADRQKLADVIDAALDGSAA